MPSGPAIIQVRIRFSAAWHVLAIAMRLKLVRFVPRRLICSALRTPGYVRIGRGPWQAVKSGIEF